MPPAANSVPTSSKSKISRFSTSPDSESTFPEQEAPVVTSSKKKKKNAASRQAQNGNNNERTVLSEVTREDTSPPVRPQTILSQIPHAFSLPTRRDSPLLDLQDDDDVATSEKISDQDTPPGDAWFDEAIYGKSPPIEQDTHVSRGVPKQIEPGFSTRGRYTSKSPPVSPPQKYARPISFGGGIPPVPSLPRGSPSTFAYTPGAYGSPPAPHMPQQHFYQAQDVNLGFQRSSMPQFRDEPTLLKYTALPYAYNTPQQGIILGFEGSLNILRLNGGIPDEIGVLEGLSGHVVDAALLEWTPGSESVAERKPIIAVIIHGPREADVVQGVDIIQGDGRPNARQTQAQPNGEYTTRVEIYSMATCERIAILLETPGQMRQSAFRGAPPSPPGPIGNLRFQSSGAFLIVTSGSSGEVYVFTASKGFPGKVECIGKFWTNIQPQIQRRDSSLHPSSDADISPADLGRASSNVQRAISSVNGRWLAISPANSPSRPSLGAVVGPDVICSRLTGIESTSAPARPSITCEVDSPDADTLFSKVARGVAQELVKGAKWLGDQGYQTWQSYWRKDTSPSASSPQPIYSPPVHPTVYTQNSFPPTHGESQGNSKQPELVAIYDLQALHETMVKKGADEVKPLATFQPPRGCSFVSFAPHGLNLLTGGRKGDVQYIWDLMQIKNCRTFFTSTEDDRVRTQPRVRQIAKYERLSGSTIVDIIWDLPAGSRFAVLTRNKTIHLYDLPASAFRWPPPRALKKLRPNSKSMDSTQHDAPVASGFFASAMNIANQAQPMFANLRGRTPSMGGGLAGIGQTSLGLASATGARGSKVVAAGLSKSLGAASETVNQIRHAGENRLHIKSSKEPLPGKIFWIQQGRKCLLAVIDHDSVKQYQVRRNKIQDRRDRENGTVFAARKAVAIKFPPLSKPFDDEHSHATNDDPEIVQRPFTGFWKIRPSTSSVSKSSAHPLSFAEIETNAPYQPFHSDARVILSVYSDLNSTLENQLPGASQTSNPQSRTKKTKEATPSTKWVFGDDIRSITLNISKIQIPEDDNEYSGSVIYRETMKVSSPSAGDDDMDQIVSTTRRRKVKKNQNTLQNTGSDVEKEDGFFEDDCDVLDFATDRV